MNAPTINGYGGLGETTNAITPEEADLYFVTEVLPLFTLNPLKETMIQKYLAFLVHQVKLRKLTMITGG